MVAIGICWEGQSRPYFVEGKAKINKEYFLENVLQPMVVADMPRLYGDRANEVVLHMDAAPAHMANLCTSQLRNYPQKFIKKAEWPANSPDLAPLDYSVNGTIK